MKKLPLILLPLIPVLLFGQTKLGESKWESKYGLEFKTPIEYCQLVQNATGTIAMVGYLRGEGLYFATLDPQTGNIYEDFIFKKNKGIPTATIPLANGFLVAAKSQGNKGHATLWQVDASGKNWEPVQGSLFKEFDAINDMVTNADGDILLVGQKDQRLAVLRLNRLLELEGEVYIKNGSDASTAKALALHSDGTFFVTGYEEVKRQPQLLFLRFNPKANRIWSKPFEAYAAWGNDVIISDKEEVIITGTTRSSETLEDVMVLKFDLNGQLIGEETYQKQGEEYGEHLIQTPDRHLLVGGKLYLPGGARTSDTYLKLLNQENLDTINTLSEGDIWDDQIQALLKLNNGDIIIAENVTEGSFRNSFLRLRNIPYSPCEVKLADGEYFYFNHGPIFAHEYIENSEFRFKGTIVSKFPLDQYEINIRNKGGGVKSSGTFFVDTVATHPGQYCYEFEKTIDLDAGNNIVRLMVEKEGQLLKDSVSVFHFPKRPNLHLLSIGINNDLEYADEDARDFAKLFVEQENKLFKNVYQTVLNTPDETTAQRVINEFLNLKDRYEGLRDPQITPDDVLIIFISSHGTMIDGSFTLLANGFREDNESTHLHFQKHIMDKLESIDCRKLVFLDACKSGGAQKSLDDPAKDELIDNILRIANTAPGISILSSCGEKQASFEDDSFKNGLFTEAIIQGLRAPSSLVNPNEDKVITLDELYRYLKVRVPQLAAQTYNNNPDKKQTPTMPTNELDELFPLFYLGKAFY